MLNFQQRAAGFGRTMYQQAGAAYQQLKPLASGLDKGYQAFKTVHSAMAPALAASNPELARFTRKAMTGYEATRSAVLGAHTIGASFV